MSRINEQCLWTLYMMFDPVHNIWCHAAHAPGAATTAPRATQTRRHREETPHAALVEISARTSAPRRRPSASHSIRVGIFRHHAHIGTDRGANRARDALKI